MNWCPRCVTAVSDLEVVHEETQGKLYEIRYPVVESPNEFIIVATTRPETMLGDTAIAVNSGDDRYRHLHGKKVMLPLMNREIPIIADDIRPIRSSVPAPSRSRPRTIPTTLRPVAQ